MLHRTLNTTLTTLLELQGREGQDTVVKHFSLERPCQGRTLIKIDLQTRIAGQNNGSEDVAIQTYFTRDTSVSCDIDVQDDGGVAAAAAEVKKRSNTLHTPLVRKDKRHSVSGSLSAKDAKRLDDMISAPKPAHEKSVSGFALPWKRAAHNSINNNNNNGKSRDSPFRDTKCKPDLVKTKADVHKDGRINKAVDNKDAKAKPATVAPHPTGPDAKQPETAVTTETDEAAAQGNVPNIY